MRPSYHYNGNPFTGKTTSLYWDNTALLIMGKNIPRSSWSQDVDEDIDTRHIFMLHVYHALVEIRRWTSRLGRKF